MAARTAWSRDQLLIAFKLYCEMPFGKMHSRNPDIIKGAQLLGRTPSALAMKLTNIASLDPAITSTGRSGLRAASNADRAMWEEMESDWESFIREIEQAETNLMGGIPDEIEENEAVPEPPSIDYTGTDVTVSTKARRGQGFFRRSILAAYNSSCCITGLSVEYLLVASHILPWSLDERNRLNPRNGLCLSSLHDAAFDLGIITIADDLTVIVSEKYSDKEDKFFHSALQSYHGKPIYKPEKFAPTNEFLEYHRNNVFEKYVTR